MGNIEQTGSRDFSAQAQSEDSTPSQRGFGCGKVIALVVVCFCVLAALIVGGVYGVGSALSELNNSLPATAQSEQEPGGNSHQERQPLSFAALPQEESSYPAGEPLPVSNTAPSHRQLQRVYFALVREATLQGLQTDPGKGGEDAKRMSLLRDAVITACARAGEMPDVQNPDFYLLGKRLYRLTQANGNPPALRVLAAHLVYYAHAAPEEVDACALREELVKQWLPPEKEIARQPPLVQALWHRHRTDYSSVEITVQGFRRFVEEMIAAADSLPPPATAEDGVSLCRWPAQQPLPGYDQIRMATAADAMLRQELSGDLARRSPLGRRALENRTADALLAHRYTKKASEGGLWLLEKNAEHKDWQWFGHLCQGLVFLYQAWDARGGGLAGSVTDTGWQGFESSSRQAAQEFTEAYRLRPDLPQAAGQMIKTLKGCDSTPQKERQWLDRALKACPDYEEALDNYRFFTLEPRWGGSAEWLRQFGYECLQAGRYDTDRPFYGWFLLRLYYSKQDKIADWRQIWRQPQMKKSGEDFFRNVLAAPGQAQLHERLRTEQALFHLWCGEYALAQQELNAQPRAPQQLRLTRTPGFIVSWGDIGWQRIQDELQANTGKYTEQIRAGEAKLFAGDIPGGIALWSQVIRDCRGKDDATASYLRWRGGYILTFQLWDLSDDDFKLDRSALYLAVAHDDRKAVDWLLENGEPPLGVNADGTTALYAACLRDRTEMLRRLLATGPDREFLNRPQGEGGTLLRAAVRHGSAELIAQLLDAGEDINPLDDQGETPLYMACYLKKENLVRLLLERGADPELTRRKNGFRPLHQTANNGDTKTMAILLDHKADINAVASRNRTALYIATVEEKPEAVALLLERGADSTVHESKVGWTPLHFAAAYNDAKSLALLLQHKADVHAQSKSGEMPLHVAARHGSLDTMRLLLAAGAKVNAPDKARLTALHAASKDGQTQAVALLLDAGADINAVTESNSTALYMAVNEQHPEIIRMLLERHADPAISAGEARWSPLHVATYRGDTATMRQLLACKVDVNARMKAGDTSLHIAAKKKKDAAIALLLEYHADINLVEQEDGETPLHAAAQSDAGKCIELLLQQKADVNVRRKDGETPLHVAARYGSLEAMRLLLAAGAKVDAVDEDGAPPLYTASNNEEPQAAALLLKMGADPQAGKKNGWTPLMAAAEDGNKDLVKLLLDAGAKVNAVNNQKAPPLYYACRESKTDAARLLIERGADPELITNDGWTPLMVSAWAGNADLVRLLLEHGADPARKSGSRTALTVAKQNSNEVVLLLKTALANQRKKDTKDSSAPAGGAATRAAAEEEGD